MDDYGHFANREEAGRKLAALLKEHAGAPVVVLALPRGGVPVAKVMAEALDAALDLALVRKIGAPMQPELAVGAVADGDQPVRVVNDEIADLAGADEAYLKAEERRQLDEIERRRTRYLGERPRAELKDKTVILVDDGIATGATMRAAVLAAKAAGAAKTIVAVPVAAPDAVVMLKEDADEVISILLPDYLGGISAFYRDFHQLTDDEVVALMAE